MWVDVWKEALVVLRIDHYNNKLGIKGIKYFCVLFGERQKPSKRRCTHTYAPKYLDEIQPSESLFLGFLKEDLFYFL